MSEPVRILGLDLGTKRIGVALSDELGWTAQPLGTIARTSDRDALAQIARLVTEHGVQAIVVGHPLNMDGSAGPSARAAEKVAAALDRGAFDAPHLARARVDDLGAEAAGGGPLEVHAQQHLRPVLRLRAAGARLDVEVGVVRVHLAAEHALELELADLGLDLRQVALDLAGGGLVVLGLGELQQLDGIGHRAGGRVHLLDLGGEARALLAELLGLLGLLPDGGVFEFAADFLEPLFLQIVLKETPLRS